MSKIDSRLLWRKELGKFSAIIISVLFFIIIFAAIFRGVSSIAVDVPEFSPDGQNLILGIRTVWGSGIYTIKLDDLSFKRIAYLPLFSVVAEPSYSPDGKKIVFRGMRKGDRNNHLFLINSDGSNLKQLTDSDKNDVSPVFAKNSKRILFVRGLEENDSALSSVSIEDLKVEPISRYLFTDAVSISPDGQSVFILANRNSEGSEHYMLSIHRIDLSNNLAETVFEPYIAQFNPVETRAHYSSLRGKASVLPNGQELIVGGFLKLDNLKGQPISDSHHMIFRYNLLNGSVQKIVETTKWYGAGPNVSPDGRKMVFCTGVPYSCDTIYIANIDGSDLNEIKVSLK